ncbi:MAG: hypothetical protein KAW17_13455 [Candidatus Eisenbacteria sp.]|nr:hypothetical protein [Candidatus Eisenbacteria bacterium]
MALERGRIPVLVLIAAVVPLAAFLGCGGEEGPSAPELGEEIDLSIYAPAGFEGYSTTYSLDRGRESIEVCTTYRGTEAVYDVNPETGGQVLVDCCVLEEDGEGGNEPDVRIYRCGNYEYAIKTCVAGRWGPLYYFQPKRQLAPDENPRINSVFDSGTSSLFTRFEMYDVEYRQVQSYRTWTTYLAIENSLTVPAGTFQDVLKTSERVRIHTKQTVAADTTAVVYENHDERIFHVWRAPGLGIIRVMEVDGRFDYEKTLVRAIADAREYPIQAR